MVRSQLIDFGREYCALSVAAYYIAFMICIRLIDPTDGTHIYLYPQRSHQNMVDGDDQQSLSQFIKDNLQEGVQTSIFRHMGPLNSDTVIDESRTVSLANQLDGIITYRQSVLPENRLSTILLCGSPRAKRSPVNAVCQQILESANLRRDRFSSIETNCRTIRVNDRAV